MPRQAAFKSLRFDILYFALRRPLQATFKISGAKVGFDW